MQQTLTIAELQAKLRKIAQTQPEKVTAAMDRAVLNVVAKAKDNCTPGLSPYYRAPHITGNLSRSISGLSITDRNNIHGIVSAGDMRIGNTMSYAPHVHEGTTKMPARPFILDAIIAEEERTLAFLEAAIEENLKEHTE